MTKQLSFDARSYNNGVRVQLCDVEIWLSRRYASALLTVFQRFQSRNLPGHTTEFPRVYVEDRRDYLKVALTFSRSYGYLDVIARIPRARLPEVTFKLRNALAAL